MADRSMQLLLDALTRAASAPAGLPLVGKNALFPATAAGKEAAQRCKDQRLLHVIRSEGKGKSSVEICRLTEQGMALLLEQTSPRQVLAGFIDALEARQNQLDALVAAARQTREELKELHAALTPVLACLAEPPAAPQANIPETILTHLDMWQAAGALDDLPLPELYERVNRVSPLSIGQFHDALRTLIEAKQLYLHPWTGPLYALPQPQFALLVGHQVAYYASLRGSQLNMSA